MAHFYGSVLGNRGAATRLGGKSSGLDTEAAGWKGCIHTHIYHDDATGKDMYRVVLKPWSNSGGETREIASGVLDANG